MGSGWLDLGKLGVLGLGLLRGGVQVLQLVFVLDVLFLHRVRLDSRLSALRVGH